jgi:hypothetical protein
MRKTVNLKLVADYTPEPDPPEASAELSLQYTSYTVTEGLTQDVTIVRLIRQDQVLEVDWAAVNVSVLPVSGTVRFEIGETTKVVQVTAQQVDTNEQGFFNLSNPQWVSGPYSQPLLGSNNSAFFFVNDTFEPPTTDFAAYPDPLENVIISGVRSIVNVATDAEFGTALAAAQAGDTIRLAAGTYSSDQTIDAIGTPSSPILIEGAENFGTKWDAVLRLEGQHIYVNGFDCSIGSAGRFRLSGYCNKVLGCNFGNQEAANAINVDRVPDITDDKGGSFGEIAYCDFGTQGPNPPWQPGDDFPGFRQQIKMFTDSVYNIACTTLLKIGVRIQCIFGAGFTITISTILIRKPTRPSIVLAITTLLKRAKVIRKVISIR